MLEKFTSRAAKVLAYASEESASFNHTYIGPEHVLLGLIREKRGVGGYVLKTCFNIDLQKARQKVKKFVKGPPSSSIETIEYASKEAQAQNASCIGTEHLLLGLLQTEREIITQILMEFNCCLEDVRKEVFNIINPTIIRCPKCGHEIKCS